MHYCPAHTTLLPDDVPSLPMPDTRLQQLWLLAALHKRRRMEPVPHGPLVNGHPSGKHLEGEAPVRPRRVTDSLPELG